MRKLVTCFFILFFFDASANLATWGVTGHRIVGQIAENHLSSKARKKLSAILNGKSLAYVSTWMDEIRSDSTYDHIHDWHWVTIPDSLSYHKTEKNPNGDIIQSITLLISELKTHSLDSKTEAEHVKILIHLVGDIHQPLHVGTGLDQGGNEARGKYFGSSTNLHSVWDSRMIDGSKYSYTELASALDNISVSQIKNLQEGAVLDWANESKELRRQVYDLPDHGNLSYEYVYRKWSLVEQRLLEAGIRLAGVLNEIYN